MSARAIGCCAIIGFSSACLAAAWLAGKIAERREAREQASGHFAEWERELDPEARQ